MAGSAPAFLESIPLGAQLWPIFVALIILIVGMIIAKIIRKVVAKALGKVGALHPVSYTHLTLPTICSV